MSAKAKQIRDRLTQMSQTVGPAPTILGEVTSIDQGAGTCVIVDDEITYNDVRLHAVLDGTEAQYITPKVGALALAVRIENTGDWFLLSTSELEQWNIKIGTAEIEQDKDGLLIKKGSVTLNEILTDIISAVSVIVVLQGTPPDYAALTAAQQKVQTLLKS